MDGALKTDWESYIQQAWIKELFLCCCDKHRLPYDCVDVSGSPPTPDAAETHWWFIPSSKGWSLGSFCLYRKDTRELWNIGGCGEEKEGVLDFSCIQCWWSEHFLQVICRNSAACSLNLCDMDTKTVDETSFCCIAFLLYVFTTWTVLNNTKQIVMRQLF